MALMDTAKIEAEVAKLIAESVKFNAETAKLQAETAKLNRERMWYPVVVAASILGALLAAAKFLI